MSAPTRNIVRETLDWRGMLVEVSYEAEWLGGDLTAHLEVRTLEPEGAALPITKTGYRSRFLLKGVVEEASGPAAYVQAWLNEASLDRKWIAAVEAARQGNLFEP